MDESACSAIFPSNYDEFVENLVKCEQEWGITDVDADGDLPRYDKDVTF